MKTAKSIVLQVGESIHTHTLQSKQGIQYDDEPSSGRFHFLLKGKGILVHEEHGTMVFKKGNYMKFPQVEFDPMDQSVRNVFD